MTTDELDIKLATKVLVFIEHNIYKFYDLGLAEVDLRIAIPEYMLEHIFRGVSLLRKRESDQEKLMGVKAHPTWQNEITFYFTGVQVMGPKCPTLKFSIGEDLQKELNRIYNTEW